MAPLDVHSLIAACANAVECEQQCTEKRAAGCVSAGRLYEFGHGVSTDAAKAFHFYDAACELKDAAGCYNAAVLLEVGKGVARDPARAQRLFKSVCQMGSKTACARAERLVDAGP
jgi:TPR repeat protein